jgi:alkylation response protein AidB-like acyl-CoA dehydrogenase
VNLETTVEEDQIISEASRVLDRLAPVSRFNQPDHLWSELVGAGWADMGASLEEGVLEIAAAAGIFRAAGRHLLVEQLATSAYLLPALARHVPEAKRRVITDRLARAPGVICGEGRAYGPVVGEPASGLCFGIEEPFDLYHLGLDGGGHLTLNVAEGDLERVQPVAGLALSMGHVSPAERSWVVAPLDLDREGLERIWRNLMLLHCAALIGAAEATLTLTRDYTLNRIQFGTPIAAFQALKHSLADVLAGNEVAWSALLCALADGAVSPERALVARILTVEAAYAAARAGAQFHGGIGFTAECDLHYFLKTLVEGAQRFGSTDELGQRLGLTVVEEVLSC